MTAAGVARAEDEDAGLLKGAHAAPPVAGLSAGNQPRVRLQNEQTESMTGTRDHAGPVRSDRHASRERREQPDRAVQGPDLERDHGLPMFFMNAVEARKEGETGAALLRLPFL